MADQNIDNRTPQVSRNDKYKVNYDLGIDIIVKIIP